MNKREDLSAPKLRKCTRGLIELISFIYVLLIIVSIYLSIDYIRTFEHIFTGVTVLANGMGAISLSLSLIYASFAKYSSYLPSKRVLKYILFLKIFFQLTSIITLIYIYFEDQEAEHRQYIVWFGLLYLIEVISITLTVTPAYFCLYSKAITVHPTINIYSEEPLSCMEFRRERMIRCNKQLESERPSVRSVQVQPMNARNDPNLTALTYDIEEGNENTPKYYPKYSRNIKKSRFLKREKSLEPEEESTRDPNITEYTRKSIIKKRDVENDFQEKNVSWDNSIIDSHERSSLSILNEWKLEDSISRTVKEDRDREKNNNEEAAEVENKGLELVDYEKKEDNPFHLVEEITFRNIDQSKLDDLTNPH